MKLSRLAYFFLFLITASGCKVIQIVPEGGAILSRTGANNCASGQTCEIDVPNGQVFSETFTAEPDEGYRFAGWKRADRYLCGGSAEPCALENVPGELTDQDIDLFLEPVFEYDKALSDVINDAVIGQYNLSYAGSETDRFMDGESYVAIIDADNSAMIGDLLLSDPGYENLFGNGFFIVWRDDNLAYELSVNTGVFNEINVYDTVNLSNGFPTFVGQFTESTPTTGLDLSAMRYLAGTYAVTSTEVAPNDLHERGTVIISADGDIDIDSGGFLFEAISASEFYDRSDLEVGIKRFELVYPENYIIEGARPTIRLFLDANGNLINLDVQTEAFAETIFELEVSEVDDTPEPETIIITPAGGVFEIFSDSNPVILTVPEDAVDSEKEITIAFSEDAEREELFDKSGIDSLLALRFEPEDLVFEKPVVVTSNLTGSTDVLIFGSLFDDDTSEPLDVTVSNVDDNTIAVSFEITRSARSELIEVGYKGNVTGPAVIPLNTEENLLVSLQREASNLTNVLSASTLKITDTNNIIIYEDPPLGSIGAIAPGESVVDQPVFTLECESEGEYSLQARLKFTVEELTFDLVDSPYGTLEPVSQMFPISGFCLDEIVDGGDGDGSGGDDPEGSGGDGTGGDGSGSEDPEDPGGDGEIPEGDIEISLGIGPENEFILTDVTNHYYVYPLKDNDEGLENVRDFRVLESTASEVINLVIENERFPGAEGIPIGYFSCDSTKFEGPSTTFTIEMLIQRDRNDGTGGPEIVERVSITEPCYRYTEAVSDEAETTVDTSVIIDVTQNDINPYFAYQYNDGTTENFSNFINIDSEPSSGTVELIESSTQFGMVIKYTPDPGFVGEDYFSYRLDIEDPPTAPRASQSAFVDVTVNSPTYFVLIDEFVLSADLGKCFKNSEGTTICGDGAPTAAVSAVQLPSGSSTCAQSLDLGEGSSSDTVSEFNCPKGDGLTFQSNSGSATFTSSNGELNVTVNADGSLSFGATDVLTDPGFNPLGDQLIIGTGTDSVMVPVVLESSTGEPVLDFPVIDGLQTQVEVEGNYDWITVFLYTHDNTTESSGQPSISGLIEKRPVTDGTQTPTGYILPIISPELAAYITDNGIDITEDIVVSVRNEAELGGAFETSAGALNSTLAGGGVVARIDPSSTSADSDPNAVASLSCTSRPVNVRCSAGTEESLLVVNNSDDIARYSPVDGSFQGFYFGGTTPNFTISTGYEASQGPDNCVVYTDLSGDVHLYDGAGDRVESDGLGNVQSGGGPLLDGGMNGVSEYSGFAFFTPDDGISWKLLLAQKTSAGMAQLVSYDYALTGDAVLSNPQVLFEVDGGDFNDVAVIGDSIYLSDTTPDSSVTPQDLVRVFSFEGIELPSVVTDAVTPTQISPTLDGGLVLADFARESVRVFDLDGTSRRDYLVGDGDGSGNDRIRGVFPLQNGNYLVSGRSDFNRRILDREDGSTSVVTDGRSTSGYLIGNACLQPILVF